MRFMRALRMRLVVMVRKSSPVVLHQTDLMLGNIRGQRQRSGLLVKVMAKRMKPPFYGSVGACMHMRSDQIVQQ